MRDWRLKLVLMFARLLGVPVQVSHSYFTAHALK
jgi:hypothetical protein